MRQQLAFAAAFAALSSFAHAQLYATDFTTDAGWTLIPGGCVGGYDWAVDATPANHCAGPYRSAPASLNFNNGVDIGGTGAHGGAAVTCGYAVSPVIDLATAAGEPHLVFWASWNMEIGCGWDPIEVRVYSTSGAMRYSDCLSASLSSCTWREFDIPMDRAWGTVQIEFYFHTLDDWWNGGSGPFIDDLAVLDVCTGGWSTHCVGDVQSDGRPGASIGAGGSPSVAVNDVRLIGTGFPVQTFAAAFYGSDPGIIPGGNGTRCIGAQNSYRLAVAATGAAGAPSWSVDLAAPPLPGGAILGGSSWYFQTIYRDGTSFNFSDAILVRFCD